MKKYLVFLSLLFVGALQGVADNTCIISRFYDETGTITQTTYNQPFNIDVSIHYDPTTPADQLLVNIQLPVNNYACIQSIVPNITTLIIGTVTTNGNILTVPITGFGTTDFTLHILKVYLAPNEACTITSFTYSAFMQSSLNSIINTTATSASSLSIDGKHRLGDMQIYPPETFHYDDISNANSPLYFDFNIDVYQGTYLTTDVFFSLSVNPNLSIKKVVLSNNTVLAANADGKYQLSLWDNPATSMLTYLDRSTIRVYFDINATPTQPFTLNLNVAANFNISCGVISGNSFTGALSSPNQITVKNDDLILQYPSIYDAFNYNIDDVSYVGCQGPIDLTFNLDNIYNQAISNSSVITTFDNIQNLTINKLVFSLDMLPIVSIKYVGSGSYQLMSYDSEIPTTINIPGTSAIQSIQMQYNQVLPKISTMTLNVSISSGNGSVTYNLLKAGAPYMHLVKTITVGNSPPNQTYVNGPALLGIGNTVTNVVEYVFYKTLSTTDYVEYQLNPNMTFATDLQLLFSIDGSTWSTKDVFNSNNPPLSSDPSVMDYQITGQKISITHIPIGGYYSTCNASRYVFYVKLNTTVVDRPTSKININSSYFVASDGTTATPYGYNYYNWEIDITQSNAAYVNLSCNNTAYSTNLKLKTNDNFSVQYTLENLVANKYSNTPITFYFNLVKPGITPNVSLGQLSGLNTSAPITILPVTAYTIYYASGSSIPTCATLENNYCDNLTYVMNTVLPTSTVMKVVISPTVTFDYYDKLILTAQYPSGLALKDSIVMQFATSLQTLHANWIGKSTITVGPQSDCDVFDCTECITSFSPMPNKEYLLSAWVKESVTGSIPTAYTHSGIQISFNDGAIVLPLCKGSGPIVDGWQRIEYSFVVPGTANNIHVTLVNQSPGADVFFDDIRMHPYNSNMKSFVYDPSTQKLTAELDENNYATLYEYDDEGILIRVKKETERGVMTIKETRSNQSKVQNNAIKP